MMMVMGLMLVMLLLAYVVETAVEFLFGELFRRIAILRGVGWCQRYIAVGVAVWLAFIFRLDLFYVLSEYLEFFWEPLSQPSAAGTGLTGIMMGMGSSYLHDVIKQRVLNSRKLLVKEEGREIDG